MFTLAILISIVSVGIVLIPIIFFKPSSLQSASSENSIERLEAIKEAVLKRYIEDEKAFENSTINKLSWEQRKSYLTNRYLDAAKRLDYLNFLHSRTSK